MAYPERFPFPLAMRAPRFRAGRSFGLACLAAVLVGSPREVLAHHMLDGAVPNTLIGGLLSGIGHPVIGADHLVFLIAAGVLAALMQAGVAGDSGSSARVAVSFGRRLPLAFVGASLVGCLVLQSRASSPYAELGVAVTLVAAGLLLATGAKTGRGFLPAAFALAGLAHGFAYAASIVGAEPTPVAGYLAGLAVVQTLVAQGAFLLTRWLARQPGPGHAVALRAFGLVVGLIGVWGLVAAF